jgi:hypothetical protein
MAMKISAAATSKMIVLIVQLLKMHVDCAWRHIVGRSIELHEVDALWAHMTNAALLHQSDKIEQKRRTQNTVQ